MNGGVPLQGIEPCRGKGIALACGLGQGRIFLPPAGIQHRPVRFRINLTNEIILKMRTGNQNLYAKIAGDFWC